MSKPNRIRSRHDDDAVWALFFTTQPRLYFLRTIKWQLIDGSISCRYTHKNIFWQIRHLQESQHLQRNGLLYVHTSYISVLSLNKMWVFESFAAPYRHPHTPAKRILTILNFNVVYIAMSLSFIDVCVCPWLRPQQVTSNQVRSWHIK